MKAQILKIAGVKNESEFYRKFPTEEAFMKKHGKELKKAQIGAVIKPAPMPKVEMANLAKTKEFGLTKLKDIPASKNRGFDYTDTLGMLANQAGSIVGLSQSIADKYGRQSKELDQSDQMIGLAKKAAASAPKPPQQKYVRPEDQIIQPINPLGVQGFGYFQNGGEIQNTFAPNDIYTDMGYEPLNDSNPKQYQAGGVVADAAKSTGGFDPSSFMSAAGSLGGGLGSLMGGSDFEQTEEGQLASTILGAAGTAIGGPIGGLIGAGVGGLAGGIFGGNKNKEMKAKRQNQQNAIAGLTGTANIQNMNQGSAYVRNGGHIPSYEDGGWMNPEYNPQMIAKFGDYDVNQLLAPPHDADMLRAGGHLKEYTPPSAQAMYTGRDLPYQMANGGQMAMGGELQTLWGGGLETISRNPYDNSEIIMPKGQSHDESDGRGRTGIGIKYGDGGMSDYAEYGASDQDASVEVERNEPMVKMADGGNADNLVVFGNMIEDESKKKYKVLAKEIAKDNNKQTKIMQKAALNANNNDDDTVFGQFAKNTDYANTIGPDMKLKENSMTLKHYAAKQNAILDTAKEFGLESDALAKGKIKYAKPNDPYAEFGAKLSKAQKGKEVKKYDPEFENFINKAMMLEQANSSQEITLPDGRTLGGVYRGGAGNFGTGNRDNGAYNTPEKAKEFYYKNYWSKVKDLPAGLRTRALQMAINTGDPYGELMVAGEFMSPGLRARTKDERKDKDITSNKKWNSAWNSVKDRILTAYKEDPQGFLSKLDKEQDRYYDSYIANNPSDINPNTRKEFFDDYTGLARFASQQYIPSNDVTPIAQPAPAIRQTAIAQAPVRQAQQMGNLDSEDIVIENKNVKRQPPMVAAPTPQSRYSASSSQFPSPIDEQGDYYMPISEPTPGRLKSRPFQQMPVNGIPLPQLQSLDLDYSQQSGDENKTNWWETGTQFVNSLIPYMRPSNQMQLSPQQISGELLALSDNTLDPVYAQSYQPMYTQPTSISYQDQLNANQADFNAMQRQFGYSPEVVSALAAQKYGANTKVLGEQFRANQAEQQRARETNRETANDAQLKNMGIYQDQANKMAQTKSIMKQQKIAALNSMNDKYLKNQLENRQLAIGENMYNYRYSPNGVAYNVNPLANFAPYGSGAGSGKGKIQGLPNDWMSLYDETGAFQGTKKRSEKEQSTSGKNGAIVKAIKNL